MIGVAVALGLVAFFAFIIACAAWGSFVYDRWLWEWWSLPLAVAPLVLTTAIGFGVLAQVSA